MWKTKFECRIRKPQLVEQSLFRYKKLSIYLQNFFIIEYSLSHLGFLLRSAERGFNVETGFVQALESWRLLFWTSAVMVQNLHNHRMRTILEALIQTKEGQNVATLWVITRFLLKLMKNEALWSNIWRNQSLNQAVETITAWFSRLYCLSMSTDCLSCILSSVWHVNGNTIQ